MIVDGAECIVNETMNALRDVFRPDSAQPPLGGGTERVRLFAGEATPLSAFDAHINGCDDCKAAEPFVWVRVARRYRSAQFPQQYVGDDGCDKPRVLALELGVARCAAVFDEDCDWSAYESEAEVSLDDSWRVELALCRARNRMKSAHCSDQVASDAVVPVGPEGGVIAWVGMLYARIDS